MALLVWLTGSKTGMLLAGGLLIAAIIGAALLRATSVGAARERAKQIAKTLENLRSRIKSDDEISSLPAADRRERLRQWQVGE